MSLWVIIPVKPLKNAKSRLASVLLPEERYDLAQAMLRHVLSVATAIQNVTGVLVISRDAKALAIARELGAKTLLEGTVSNLNPALMRATMVVKTWRADAVLILPADLPFVSVEDVRAIIDMGQDRSIVIATDRGLDGTNALLVRPPGALEYEYGAGSFARHVEQAEGVGMRVLRYQSEQLSLDIDVPGDLADYQRILAGGRFGHLPSFPLVRDAG